MLKKIKRSHKEISEGPLKDYAENKFDAPKRTTVGITERFLHKIKETTEGIFKKKSQ